MMDSARFALLILLGIPLLACASTLTIMPDRGLLEEEVARLPPRKPIPLRVSIKVDAPELATGLKPGRKGEPAFNLEYPARKMLEQAAQAVAGRWFQKNNQNRKTVHLEVRLHSLLWDKYRDVLVWRPVVSAEIELRAESDSRTLVQQVFTSGKQKGDWVKDFTGQTMITTEHQPQYARLIYRALLVALDKAMADVVQILAAPPPSSRIQAQNNLVLTVPPSYGIGMYY